MSKIAIIGGGVAGGTAALYLGALGLDVTLFEKKAELISGPPFCHLHSGGNLYREISDEQCITLLEQSIDLLRFYPYAIDFRPTVIVTPKSDDEDPSQLTRRLVLLQEEYKSLIDKDPNNEVLGDPKNYFQTYTKEELINLQKQDEKENPKTLDEWMIPVAKNIDLNNIKYPVVIVQEYGINLFQTASGLALSIKEFENTNILFNTTVTNVSQNNDKFTIEYTNNNNTNKDEFDFLINAAGFQTGQIDDMLEFSYQRFVEFKAAYVTNWENKTPAWPEIIFHGKRGTPEGMAQFTPYADNYFQLHGMTNSITLFEDGLVQSSDITSYPKLKEKFIEKIEKNWAKEEVQERSQKAIKHMSQFIPEFINATVASKPLYGAQQIPGDDQDLRAADVTFVGDNYARCEVVKASSVLDMTDEIVYKLIELGVTDKKNYGKRNFEFKNQDELDILKNAQSICEARKYPKSLATIRWKKRS
jgi:hypothetical protein